MTGFWQAVRTIFIRVHRGPSHAAASVLTGPPLDALSRLMDPAALVRSGVEAAEACIQGYAPIVSVTRNRRRCGGCKEPVFAGERHICLWNAEHHLASLTPGEWWAVTQQARVLAINPHAYDKPWVRRWRYRRPKRRKH